MPAAQSVPAARDPYSVGAYGPGGYGPGVEAPSGFQFDLLEYLRIAVKRRWLILSIVAALLWSSAPLPR